TGPPDNGSSGRARVSWPPTSGGVGLGDQPDKKQRRSVLPRTESRREPRVNRRRRRTRDLSSPVRSARGGEGVVRDGEVHHQELEVLAVAERVQGVVGAVAVETAVAHADGPA